MFQFLGVVLAFDGVYWRDVWYKRSVRPVVDHVTKFLDGTDDAVLLRRAQHQVDQGGEEYTVELEPEIVGKLDSVRLHDTSAEM